MMAIVQAYMGIWMLVLYLEVCNSYAEISHGSEEFLQSIEAYSAHNGGVNACIERRRHDVMVIRRRLRSLKALSIKGGSTAFVYDKELVLTVLEVVVGQTQGLLLM